MVGMTRAHMTDPHIVRKIVEGREDDIRPCVGANYCLDRIYQGGAAYCIHNPATGRELTMPHDIATAAGGRRSSSSARAPAVWRRRASPRSAATRSSSSRRRTSRAANPPDRQQPAAQGDDWDHRLAHGAMQTRGVPFHFNVWAEAQRRRGIA